MYMESPFRSVAQTASSSKSNCHFSDCWVNGISFDSGYVPELTVSASNIVLSYFELSRAMEIQRALLTLIANSATYGHKREYKYPIAFSHNRAKYHSACMRFHPVY